MSDEAPQPPKPPKPTAKTSTVPLKKETVRITLRAKPGAGITQPKEETTQAPTVQGSAPTPPVAKPSAAPPPPATAVAPPAPPKPPSASVGVAPPAPPSAAVSIGGDMKKTQKVTVKASPAPAGTASAPAKTVPLKGAKPVTAAGAAPANKALPKATVKLQQPTQALASESGAPQPTGTLSASDSVILEDEDSEAGLLPFAIGAAILGLGALIVAMMASDQVGIGVPEATNPAWERSTDTGWTSSFPTRLPEVPVYE